MISIVAGIYRLPWPRVLLLALVSCAVWNAVLIWIGYLLGSNWRAIEDILRQYTRVVAAVLVLGAVVWITRRRLSRSR